ncbi:MAG: hydantoinase/oxoprolinase N-terminal domain-containing protein, partial [Hyphomicrobiaceae bacterium]
MTSETVAPVRIAVDVGGTFTDLQILDTRTGSITNFKTPTTPDDPSLGLMTGIREAAARDGFAFGDIGYLL